MEVTSVIQNLAVEVTLAFQNSAVEVTLAFQSSDTVVLLVFQSSAVEVIFGIPELRNRSNLVSQNSTVVVTAAIQNFAVK